MNVRMRVGTSALMCSSSLVMVMVCLTVLAQALDTVVSSPKAPKQAAERTAKLRKAYKL